MDGTNQIVESKYNFFVPVSDQEIVGYNFLYRNLVVLEPTEYDAVRGLQQECAKAPQSAPADEDGLIAALVAQNFFVDAQFDELAFFKFNYFRSLFNSSTLVVAILPTLACNLDCPYCFEYKRGVELSDEVSDQIIAWVRAKLPGKSRLHFTWFGGEPLLAFGRIEALTAKALAVCEEHHCQYSSSILTNGCLLTPAVIRRLGDLRIHNVQVTFDGPRELHDRMRKSSEGIGSFETIVENAEHYCRLKKSHLPLSLRVNVTDENYDSVPELFGAFSEQVKRESRIYFRWVWSSEAAGCREFSTRATRAKAFPLLHRLYSQAAEAGFRIDNPTDHTGFNYCEVDFMEHFSIDPLGNLYLCSHSYSPQEAIGHVAQAMSPKSVSDYCKWMTTTPFDDEVCVNCRILPLCRGSCRRARFNGKRKCIEERFATDLYVQNLYQKCQSQKAVVPSEIASSRADWRNLPAVPVSAEKPSLL